MVDELVRVIDDEIKAKERASNTSTSNTSGGHLPKARAYPLMLHYCAKTLILSSATSVSPM